MAWAGRGRALVAAAMITGCGGGTAAPNDAGTDAPPTDAGPRPPFEREHTFPAIDLAPGDEQLSHCQSWTLNNPTELWVTEIEMSAGPGWHHSNWVFVPEPSYEGPDGTWRCRDRDFSEVAATAMGGGVFFAQSTQSTHEVQRFPEGAAYRIPPWSRVIGSVHVLNVSAAPVSTALTFRIGTLEPDQVRTRLRPLAIDNRGLELAPRRSTTVTTACDLRAALRRDLDFRVHYVLPHYHAYADGMRIEIFGGPRDGEVVFETRGGIGNALGGPLAPPVDLTGALGLRTTCTYSNRGAETITWGPLATDEMCTMLAYTDADRPFGALAQNIDRRETQGDGSELQETDCAVIAISPD